MSASWISRVRFDVMTTIGGCSAFTVPISGIVTWIVGEHFEQERLERLVGAVELVDQQHRRAGGVRLERLQQRPLDQEALGEHVVLESRSRSTSPSASASRIAIICAA